MAMQGHRADRGFTLLEVMATVAIIAILVVVVVPYFFGESRKAKGKTEVTALFGELSTKQEQFKVDYGVYFPFLGGPTVACPAITNGSPQDVTACAQTGAWTDPTHPLRVITPQSTVLCTYQITSGPSTTAPTPPAGFNMVANNPAIVPAGAWYFIAATCDLDAQGGVNTQYFTSSLDATIQIQNEGK
nr:prepilin-type N-terminal cleavage/methylation domain-containing protein [Kofleriaceae bacterium]